MSKIKSEAIRHFENAKEILNKSPIEDNRYEDIKYVQEAFGAAYLAVLKAIDEYLIKRGVGKKDLPQSIESYREMLRKHLLIHDGKLIKEFEMLYDTLHIAGYYKGLLKNVKMVKEAFRTAKAFIDKITVV